MADMQLDELCDLILKTEEGKSRSLIAVAGPPGAGKSTLADILASKLSGRGETAEVLPMDGFHMDNGILEERGLLTRKGAPNTFDLRGFVDVVHAVKAAEDEVLVPVFDRSRELAIAAARVVSPRHRFIVIEGNYLLLGEGGWERLAPLFDYRILLAPPIEDLQRRLEARWKFYGLTGQAFEDKIHGNDMPNVRLVLEKSTGADLVLERLDLESPR